MCSNRIREGRWHHFSEWVIRGRSTARAGLPSDRHVAKDKHWVCEAVPMLTPLLFTASLTVDLKRDLTPDLPRKLTNDLKS